MFDSKRLGQRIKEYRIKSGLRQTELARTINVLPSTLCEYEAGNIAPSIKVFIDIINALHCTADELLIDYINGNRINLDEISDEDISSVIDLINNKD